MSGELKVEVYTLGDLMTNCYLLHDNDEALLIDPGSPSKDLAIRLLNLGLDLLYIINTHGHIDHIQGNDFFMKSFPDAKIIIYEADMLYLTRPELNLSIEFSEPYYSPEPDILIHGEMEDYELIGENVTFYHTPGHTPGSMCLWFPRQGWLFCGDTIFAGSIGRTDLPGGSFQKLIESLKLIMKNFPGHTILYPGHGPQTTLDEEKRMNPYVIEYLSELD